MGEDDDKGLKEVNESEAKDKIRISQNHHSIPWP